MYSTGTLNLIVICHQQISSVWHLFHSIWPKSANSLPIKNKLTTYFSFILHILCRQDPLNPRFSCHLYIFFHGFQMNVRGLTRRAYLYMHIHTKPWNIRESGRYFQLRLTEVTNGVMEQTSAFHPYTDDDVFFAFIKTQQKCHGENQSPGSLCISNLWPLLEMHSRLSPF